ncbi:hypothetical protein ACFL20_06560 [Spirochaetota bacterium]
MFEKIKNFFVGFIKLALGTLFFAFFWAWLWILMEDLYNYIKEIFTGKKKEAIDCESDEMVEAVNKYYRFHGKECPECRFNIPLETDICPVCNNNDFSLRFDDWDEIECDEDDYEGMSGPMN